VYSGLSRSKSILIIAYHFPPVSVSSGVHRLVSLASALVQDNWAVSVISAHKRTYERIDENTLRAVHDSVRIVRAQALDTARHLSFKGRYFGPLALPDNLQSWIPFGVYEGLREIRRNRPDIILSTYPVASAHVIAIVLSRITGIPWVADFRDPMAQEGYPKGWMKWKTFKWIERCAAKRAAKLVFTTPGALQEYKERYPDVPDNRWGLITNGYMEEQFHGISQEVSVSDELRIVHSGLIYIHERNPRQLFEALASLKQSGQFEKRTIRFVLRASGHEDTYTGWIAELGIGALVELAPAIPYRDALQEMFNADGLLLMQGAGCNQQIPAKAYEYLRVQKPVLALTDDAGDTAALLKEYGDANIAPLDCATRIAAAIVEFIERLEQRKNSPQKTTDVTRFSRAAISREWVAQLGELGHISSK